MEILGASSDHLILDAGGHSLAVGAEIRFQLNYSALVRAMSSPFVAKVVKAESRDEGVSFKTMGYEPSSMRRSLNGSKHSPVA